MAEDTAGGQERTESATPKRREEARREGRIPRSQDLSAASVLIAGTALLATAGGQTLSAFSVDTFHESARTLAAAPWTVASGTALVQTLVIRLVLALLPFLLGMGAVVTVVNLFQSRGVLSLKPITPKWSHLSPLAGIKRFVGLEAVMNLLRSMLKIAALGFVTWIVLSNSWAELISLADTGAATTAAVLGSLTIKLATIIGVAFLVLAIADYAMNWFKHEKGMRMSRQEIVQESRESEGDPMVKARVRSVARARARSRMLQAVATADVVVVNPTHIAIALRYDTHVAAAPIVVAMGERKLAERIRDIARQAGVPIVENRPVARALIATSVVGKPIPPALYAAVAEILAFVYRLRGARSAS